MRVCENAIERDGDAFSRAFESACEWDWNPKARDILRQAVVDLVASGALLPNEAQDFEDALITGQRKSSLPGLANTQWGTAME